MAARDYVTIATVCALVVGSSLSQSAADITNMRLKKLIDTSYNSDRAPVSTDGAPVTVLLNIHVRQLTLKDVDMMLCLDSADVTQSWTDPRLSAVTHDTRDLDLYRSQVDLVWKPDIHVINGRQQMMTSDHRTLTVSKSGHVTFRQRLSVDALCPNFTSHMKPLVCSVQFQPYGSAQSELVYQWDSVTFDPQLSIPKYSLISMETVTCPDTTDPNAGRYSCQQLSLSFRCHVNFFATEVYGASVLLVALSWTGFWVGGGHDKTLHRLCLGLIIVLILVIYSVGFRLLHNKVGVPGNVEVWVAFCTLFVLASLIEHVFVHVLLSAVPAQLRRICCKPRTTSTILQPSCCHHDVITADLNHNDFNSDSSSYVKAARVIDVTCGLLFPFIFIMFNVAYWIAY